MSTPEDHLYDKDWEVAAHYAIARGYRGNIDAIAEAIQRAAIEATDEAVREFAKQRELCV